MMVSKRAQFWRDGNNSNLRGIMTGVLAMQALVSICSHHRQVAGPPLRSLEFSMAVLAREALRAIHHHITPYY